MNLDSDFPPERDTDVDVKKFGEIEDDDPTYSEKDDYEATVLVLRANMFYQLGDNKEALRLYNKAVEAGSYEAMVHRGFFIAETSCENGNWDGLIEGLDEAFFIMAKMFEKTYVERIHSLLLKAHGKGLIKREKQLGLQDVDIMDIYYCIRDFLRNESSHKAGLENLLEYLDAFYCKG